ncbi:hypothetical protein [Kitasatospora sp. NPDC005856]|uniref:hypothetical protein n=1 Tax=Kitasatospora sp. NPDC005856 TaxID=3154566 RepID=UPI0033FE3C49
MNETEDQGEALPELCDLCHAVISDGSEVYFVVRDSSVVHRTDPEFDGRRLLVACGREHGRRLVEQYRDRPFVGPEQWAAEIGRALDQHPDGLSGTGGGDRAHAGPDRDRCAVAGDGRHGLALAGRPGRRAGRRAGLTRPASTA